MTLTEKKIQKILDHRMIGNSVETIALALKLPKNTVKKYLRKSNLLGYSNQLKNPYGNPQPLSSSQVGVPLLNYPSRVDQQYWTPVRSDNPAYYDQSVSPSSYSVLFSEHNQLIEKYVKLERWLIQVIEERDEAILQIQGQKSALDEKNQDNDNLKQRNTQLINEAETVKWEKENLQTKVNEQYERINEQYKHIIKIERELGEQKTKIIEIEQEKRTMQKGYHDTLEKLDDGVTTISTKLELSEKMNKTLSDKNIQLKQDVLSLKEKQSSSVITHGLVGIFGATVGWLGHEKFLEITSRSTLSPSADSGKNTRFKTVPNPLKGVIHPAIYGMGRWRNIAGIHFIGLGKGCGIVIPAALQKYLRQA